VTAFWLAVAALAAGVAGLALIVALDLWAEGGPQ
jgi:hypothetical protein